MKKTTRTGLFFLGMVLFYYLLGVVIAFIPRKMLTTNFSYVFGQLSIIIPMAVYVLVTKGDAVRTIPFHKIKVENALILVLFAYMCLPVVSFINAVSMLFTTNYVAGSIDSLQNNWFVVNVIMIALMPAIFEELAFRGMLFNGLKKNGIFAAIIISGCAFGVYHMNINQFMYAAIMGIVFAFINEASGSILGSMIIHFVFNLNTVIAIELMKLAPRLTKLLNADEKAELKEQLSSAAKTDLMSLTSSQKITMVCVYGVLAIIFTFLNIKIFKWYAKRCGKEEHIKEIIREKAKGFKLAKNDGVISLALIFAFIICIATMVIRF